MKTITVKLTKASIRTGPFTIKDDWGNIIEENISLDRLIKGIQCSVNDVVNGISLISTGDCSSSKFKTIEQITSSEVMLSTFRYTHTSSLWRHLTNVALCNNYYGNIAPYIIEYAFAYNYQDQILHSIQDYSKVFKYLPDGTGVFAYADKVELDDVWFNKVVCYNGQQSSGILELSPKPKNNMQAYLSYPKYNENSKSILFTKSDNLYQFNTFWDVVKDKTRQLFVTNCESLSIDKIVNQSNMDYTYRSFKKAPLRAKELKIRYILDNRSDTHLVSQFILSETQLSYK